MRIETRAELLQQQLADALAIERSAAPLLHWLQRNASSDYVRAVLAEDAELIPGRIATLQQISRSLGFEDRAVGSPTACGLVEGAIDLVERCGDEVNDSALLSAGLLLAHVTIAAYESLLAAARSCGHRDVEAPLELAQRQAWGRSDELAWELRSAAVSAAPAR